jgi:hypothetical protein
MPFSDKSQTLLSRFKKVICPSIRHSGHETRVALTYAVEKAVQTVVMIRIRLR